MIARIQKCGNNFTMHIPKSIATQVGLEKGMLVEVSVENRKLIIEPVSKPSLTLEQLLAEVNDANIHHEVYITPVFGDETL